MQKNWIATFTQEMRRRGRDRQFFIEPCKNHQDCVFVQLYRHTAHIKWRESIPGAAAKTLAKTRR